MSEISTTPAAHPWRDGLAAGLAAALVAGLLVALIDASSAGFASFPTLLALWAPVALGVGVGLGLVIAGFRATYGDGALRAGLARIRSERELDVALTGGLLAAAVVAVLVIGATSVLAKTLVGDVQRKGSGALLLGVAVVVLVPVLGLLGLPVYRVTRRVAAAIPMPARVPRVLALVVLGVVLILAGAGHVIFNQLDWRVLGLGGYLLFLGLPVGALLLLAIGSGRMSRLPARGAIVAVGAVIALALPLLLLRGQPAPEVRDAVADRSMGGAKLIRIYRAFLDGDGDGQSAFFGGPDCNDGNRAIYNGADEIKDNGIDENCDGRDRVSKAENPDPDPDPDPVPVATTAVAKDHNVLVIMIDTVRADRLGVAGYQRDGKSLTPRLDQLAGESTRFTRAYSQASNTPRAMPAFMTARYPSTIKVDKLFKNYPTLHDDNLMLFEVLREAGYQTLGYSSHFYFRDERNFTQGFDEYDNEGALDIAPSNKDSASPRIVPKVTAKLAELGKGGQRFAMWVHLFEPHSTYMEHDGWPITERGTAGLIQKYDYEIAYTDGFVGQILDSLEASGLAKNTVVVVVADHGEAFGVHSFAGTKMFFHGQTLYDELLHIPLLVRVPGRPAAISEAVVQLIDVAPTILDALGIARPAPFQGRSLVPALRGEALPGMPAFAELIPYPSWNHEGRAVISGDGRWKLFDRISDGKKELYDLTEDPEEKKDRFRDQTEKAQELEDLLLDFADLRKAAR